MLSPSLFSTVKRITLKICGNKILLSIQPMHDLKNRDNTDPLTGLSFGNNFKLSFLLF